EIMLQTTLHLLERVRLAAAPIHLRPSCNPGPYVVPARKWQDLFLEHPIVSSCMRPGTNDRHFSRQDVKKLWKLVNVSRPQNATHPRNARVMSYDLFEVAPILQSRHGTKLKHSYSPVVVAVPPLPKKDRTRRIEFDCQ